MKRKRKQKQRAEQKQRKKKVFSKQTALIKNSDVKQLSSFKIFKQNVDFLLTEAAIFFKSIRHFKLDKRLKLTKNDK